MAETVVAQSLPPSGLAAQALTATQANPAQVAPSRSPELQGPDQAAASESGEDDTASEDASDASTAADKPTQAASDTAPDRPANANQADSAKSPAVERDGSRPGEGEANGAASGEDSAAGVNATESNSTLVEVTDPQATTPAATSATESSADSGNQTPFFLNLSTRILLGVVLASLAIASIVGQYLRRQPSEYVNPALVRRFRQRINAWWLMCAILVFGLLLESTGTVVLFGLVSFWALREFITMAPTRRGDHRALFWALIVFTPLQYILIGLERSGYRWRNGNEIDFYGLYSIVIPVYASLFVPARIAMSGDHKRFLERSAQITVGLLICVYALSYAPALINLDLTTSDGKPWLGSPAGLLFFFVLVSQLSDILQWTWGYLVGKRVIAPDISSSRTWEGFAGGTLSTGLIGGSLMWVTPFNFWEAACMSMVIGVMGMFGGMTMSAIKRDRGVNDYGSLVLGHAGVLDRIDTICFAAPVFYHLTRFFFSAS